MIKVSIFDFRTLSKLTLLLERARVSAAALAAVEHALDLPRHGGSVV
jgi:hypothetical protein